MSFIVIYINYVKRKKEEISRLKKERLKYVGIVSDSGSKILRAKQQANSTKSQATLNIYSICFESRWATTTTDLFQYINEVNPTIIHFSGHGTENGELVFQDNNDNPKLVSREAITEMINASSDEVRLVVFNNCFSSVIAEGVVKNIESAIGMNISIGDDAAIQFASQLYSSIGFGLSLERAFNQAIISLKLEGIDEDKTPQLYTNENFNASDIYLVKNTKN